MFAGIILGVSACSGRESSGAADISNIKLITSGSRSPLTDGDTLCTFESGFPVAINTIADKLFVIFAKQDTLLSIYDKNTGAFLSSYGHVGMGPEDLLSLRVLNNGASKNDSVITMYDPNARKLLNIDAASLSINKEDMPRELFSETSINKSGDKYVSYRLEDRDYFFSISQLYSPQKISVDYPFSLSDATRKKIGNNANLFLSPTLYANFGKRRIIVSMYYMDIYYIYDFDGNLLKMVSPLGDSFDINQDIASYMSLNSEGHYRYTPGFSNDSTCYLRRIFEKPSKDGDGYSTISSEIVSSDWNGKITRIFDMPPGGKNFCVDYDQNIYMIVEDTENEQFNIIRYRCLDRHSL